MKKATGILPATVKRWLGWVICGVLTPQMTLYGTLSPLGVGLVAGVPDDLLLPVGVATLLGYWLIIWRTGSFHYLIAAAVVGGVRWLLGGLIGKRVRHSVRLLLDGVLAFAATVASGITARMIPLEWADAGLLLADGILAGGGMLLFDRAASATKRLRRGQALSAEGRATLLTVAAILIAAADRFRIGSFTPSHLVAVGVILLLARCGRAAGGALAGALIGALMAVGNADLWVPAVGYALGGTAAGAFSRFGRGAAAAGFLPTLFLVAVGAAPWKSALVWLYEAAVAGFLFLLLPKRWECAVNALLHRSGDAVTAVGVRDMLTDRLDMAAEALYSVGQTVDKVSKQLATADLGDLGTAFRGLEDSACKGCALAGWCWREQYDRTVEVFQEQIPRLRKGEGVDKPRFASLGGGRCPRTAELCEAVAAAYRAQILREGAWRRLGEIREAAACQFDGTGDLLRGFSSEVQDSGRLDADASVRVRIACEERGLSVRSAVCFEQENGRVTAELRLVDDGAYFEESAWMKEMEEACGCRLEHPAVRRNGDEVRLRLCSRTPLRCQTAAAQSNSPGERLCGDAWRAFTDTHGRQCLLLCDGMGTGSRAAVDGTMAEGLTTGMLCAGFDPDSALRLTNTALMVREGQERLATVDLLRVDPYTGRMQCLKAGAATSFLLSGGKVSRIERPSLPVGILPDVTFEKYDDRLVAGDTVVLVSDGALDGGGAWLEQMLAAFDTRRGVQTLCNTLCAEAVRRRDALHGDDITVCALTVEKNT